MITNRFLGAILLITGTCVGAGMLGLPVMTSQLGFGLSLFVIAALWGVMCFTGLLVLEVNLWFSGDLSYISMVHKTLGRWGRVIAWASFLLLLYALMVAYLMAGNALVSGAVSWLFGVDVPTWEGIVPWVIVFGLLIVVGAHAVDVINKFFMLGLCVVFSMMAAAIMPHIHVNIESVSHPEYILMALPVVMASFGYHIIIPTVCSYVQRDARVLRKVIVIGSLLPLLIYLMWQWLVFSVLPQTGPNSLQDIYLSGDAAGGLTQAVSILAGNAVVSLAVRFFIFFAVASSFIGVAMGLFDLLSDGINSSAIKFNRFSIACLTFVPPILFTLSYPQGFLMALGYGGVFVAVLHGILPALMVWRGRYHLKRADKLYEVAGGKSALLFIIIVSLVVVYAQLALSIG